MNQHLKMKLAFKFGVKENVCYVYIHSILVNFHLYVELTDKKLFRSERETGVLNVRCFSDEHSIPASGILQSLNHFFILRKN